MQPTRLAARSFLSHTTVKRSYQVLRNCNASHRVTFCLRRHIYSQQSRHFNNEREHLKASDGGKVPGGSSKGGSSTFGRIILLSSLACIGAISYIYIQPESPREHAIFSKPKFTTFDIVDKECTSSTSILITARPTSLEGSGTSSSDPYKESWEQGTWSVEFKQPQLQIARSYTPLPPLNNVTNGDLRFYIRKEHKGEMSNYLYNLPVGAQVDIRGPYPEIDIPRDVTDVVYLAGGTGIAPAFQVIHILFQIRNQYDRGVMPKIRIIWANRRREDCAGAPKQTKKSWWGSRSSSVAETAEHSGTLVQELKDLQLKYGGHLSVEYLIDEEGSFLDERKILQLTQSHSRDDSKSPPSGREGKKLLFVSGPEGFVSHFAGSKAWEGGREVEGELGGVISRLGLRDWQVCKL
ncbi:hypothetical protein F5884DRAFT_767773 [Xylogone sp. PMI_703]|nr:hypothetical protein F5884DRAFT_767773 [Xylogone sp. PMI_703]